jgi:hypothetical protein
MSKREVEAMPQVSTPDPIPGRVQQVLELFEGELAGVVFPQVDQHRLEEQAIAARELATELARLEAQVAHRAAALREALGELETTARRGVAYAKVYAEDDDALQQRLSALELAAPAAAGEAGKASRKRGRRRKAQADVDQHVLLEAS